MASFMEVLQMTRRSQNSSSYHRLLAVYFEQHLYAGGILAAIKEIQHVIDTINDGTLYVLTRGSYEYFARKGRKLADTLLIME